MLSSTSDANKQSKEHRVYNINLLKETLGDDVCNELLFVHATQAVIPLLGLMASEKVSLPDISDVSSCHAVLC